MASQGDRLRIRRARPADAAAIRDIHVASIRGLAADHYTPAQIQAWSGGRKPADYRRAMTALGELMLVAGIGDTVVGFGSLVEDEVRAIYVHPDFARRGIGGRLLAVLEREAARRGREKVWLLASLNAVEFYRTRGFRRRRPWTVPIGRSQRLEAVQMTKRLGPGAGR